MSNTAIGAARALLTRSYLGVQNALLSARDALRIAVHEGDEELAEQVRARLRHAQRDDLIAEVDGPADPMVRIEIQVDGAWKSDGEPAPLSKATEHFTRLCRALSFNGAWARENLDLHVTAVRLVDDKQQCYAYWTESGVCIFYGASAEARS